MDRPDQNEPGTNEPGMDEPRAWPGLRVWIREVIFESDTTIGKLFDVALLVLIIGSVIAVSLESVDSIREAYGPELVLAEWVFTIVFTLEYAVRLWVVERPAKYARSFFGVVDLMSILPTYLSVLVPGAQSLVAVRTLRLVRVFRVLKMARYVGESVLLMQALRRSREKITVFLLSVTSLTVVIGTVMHLIEGDESGFTDIPTGIYWAIVTMTTVGYGSIEPMTTAGRILASIVMITGYGIIAVPTGIVTAELTRTKHLGMASTRACPGCGRQGHDDDATHCKRCGSSLDEPEPKPEPVPEPVD